MWSKANSGNLIRLVIGTLLVTALLPQTSIAGQGRGRVSPELFSAMGISVFPGRRKMEPVVLPNLSGHIMQSDRQHSRLVLAVFWAAWCADCRREMPTLVNLYKRFKDQGLQILAIDLMEPPATVRAFTGEFTIDFPILLDLNGEFGRRFDLKAIPTTFLLDGKGRLIGKATGYHDWNSAKAARLIRALLTTGLPQ